MTTATSRLRRASVAGLATFATAGVAVLASGGAASAFIATVSPGTTAAVLAGGASSSLAVGASNQALDTVTLAFKDIAATPAWTAGQQITFKLSNVAGAALSNTGTSAFNTISFSAAPTVTINN
ncbi:MAG: hypothetical protein QOJ62_1374, partial [Actinomycetota bacterium]|nr:hypothetical protein [Actinomycetota bacterium]